MKNFKKVISLVLALAMVLSLATTAFGAATTSEEKAEVLYALGLFQGTSTTEYVPNLEGATDREQAMVMLSRAFAWGVVAGTTSEFPDDSSWAEPAVAEAVAREITNGVGDGTTFGAKNTVSEREVATWVDRALGQPLEGSWEANADLDSTTALDRGDLVDMIWDALMETPVDGDETLIETIVGTNDALINIAVDGGLIEQARLIPEIKFDEDALVDGILRADGAAAVLVTFQLTDSITGLPAVTDRDYEVAFSATFGTFGEQRVTAENGTATVLLTSEFLTEDVVSVINARIIESQREEDEIIGIEETVNLIMSPNPEALSDDSVGASVTDAEANEADRIILYFNKAVNVDDFIYDAAEATAAGGGAVAGDIDTSACSIEVRKNATVAGAGQQVAVESLAALKDYDGNDIPNALQVILDVDANQANALTDNSDVWVSFTDSTKALDVPSTRTFKNTDVRKPSMLSVEVVDLNTIQVNFSEAVLDVSAFSAEVLNNWQINGTLLSDDAWGVAAQQAATATVGEFVRTTGADNRHIVTINLGEDMFGDQIYFAPGTYSVQAANVGDWAKLTDDKNVMNTQTLDFVIPEDNTVPVPTITVMSPEQYLVEWNCFIAEDADDLNDVITVQKYNSTTAGWDNVDGEANIRTAPIDDNGLDFVIRPVSNSATGSRFIIESDLDWTVEYDTETNNKNYFNDLYRVFFAAGAAKNTANGKVSAETALQLTDAMYSPDTTSPTIVSIVENADDATQYDVTFTEPVKESSLAPANDGDDAATPDQEHGATAADNYDWADLPEPTYEFISDDFGFSVPGDAVKIDEMHQVVTVEPRQTLKDLYVGGWTLVVRSISDDVGNTLPTDTEDFVVAGDTSTAVAFDIEWAFADVDHFLAVENNDSTDDLGVDAVLQANDDDTDYDYVFIKFTKPLATAGDFKNVLKTSNYTLDGANLPTGTSIVANIKGYDDFDTVVDSITIRLPQGYLETVNAPHNINISKYLESADGDVLGAKGGEKTLPYVVSDFTGGAINTFAAQLAADVVVAGWETDGTPGAATTAVSNHEGMNLLRELYNAAIVDPSNAKLLAYEDQYVLMDEAVELMEADSSVAAQYRAYLTSTWTALHNAIVAQDLFLIDDILTAEEFELNFGNDVAPVALTEGRILAAGAFTASGDEVADGVLLNVVAGANDAVELNTTNNAVNDTTVTVTYNFWGVSTTMVIDNTADDNYVIDSTSTNTASASTTAADSTPLADAFNAAYAAAAGGATGAELLAYQAGYEALDADPVAAYATGVMTASWTELQADIIADDLFLIADADGSAVAEDVKFVLGTDAADMLDATTVDLGAGAFVVTGAEVAGATLLEDIADAVDPAVIFDTTANVVAGVTVTVEYDFWSVTATAVIDNGGDNDYTVVSFGTTTN